MEAIPDLQLTLRFCGFFRPLALCEISQNAHDHRNNEGRKFMQILQPYNWNEHDRGTQKTKPRQKKSLSCKIAEAHKQNNTHCTRQPKIKEHLLHGSRFETEPRKQKQHPARQISGTEKKCPHRCQSSCFLKKNCTPVVAKAIHRNNRQRRSAYDIRRCLFSHDSHLLPAYSFFTFTVLY